MELLSPQLNHRNRSNKFIRVHSSSQFMPKSLYLYLISAYDSFLGSLIKNTFNAHEQLLKESDRKIPFEKLLELRDLEDARSYVVDKDVDSVMRSSHTDQIKWLENRLEIHIKKIFSEWPRFVELTERRNLIAHCDGIISNQYVEACEKYAELNISSAILGQALKIEHEYFIKSCELLCEMAMKITHLSWRKLNPQALKDSDWQILLMGTLITAYQEYDLALKIFRFATDLPQHSSEEYKRRFVVNLALVHYLKGEKDICVQIIDGLDWSASSDEFNLAVHVLKDKYSIAIKYMKHLAEKTPFIKVLYGLLPLYSDFVKSEEFKQAYLDLYKEDFVRNQFNYYRFVDILRQKNSRAAEEETQIPTKDKLRKFMEDVMTQVLMEFNHYKTESSSLMLETTQEYKPEDMTHQETCSTASKKKKEAKRSVKSKKPN